MRYKSFHIKNFKGIKDTAISLETIAGASVFAFVGLNESGKTTVLEAIHSFSPDAATSELLGGGEGIGVPFEERVPRHLISSFTGDTTVRAVLSIDEGEKKIIAADILRDLNLTINLDVLGNEIIFERVQRFVDGDLKHSYFTFPQKLEVKGKGQRKWREKTTEELTKIRDLFYGYTPDIAYFPTFVFDFPETIYLTSRGGVLDKFYRRVFQDILDFDGRGLTIEKDIVRRVRSEKLKVSWLQFINFWSNHDDRDKIQHVIDRASSAVTRLVFGSWNQIFNENTKGKEVSISYDVVEGKIRDSRGAESATQEHDISVKFQIKDGTRRFPVNDRSLGFRWFFAFMLFTQFRVSRSSTRPLLFLFDEPASNLHAAAQQKLIDCFPQIASGPHTLVYTTHSHYMIEPKWLEQTFIVTNRADAPIDSVMDAVSLDDESLDIQVASYRSFVNSNPSKTSYFQPILDRLEVVPSRFDTGRASVILEGKSDYYLLRYASKLLGITDLPLLPGQGAGTFGALAALHVGWNLSFLFVLDGDHQGKIEKNRYFDDFGIASDRIKTLDELCTGLTVIEDILDEDALLKVKRMLGLIEKPNKAQIRRFFQERLASNQVVDLSPAFREKSAIVLDSLSKALS